MSVVHPNDEPDPLPQAACFWLESYSKFSPIPSVGGLRWFLTHIFLSFDSSFYNLFLRLMGLTRLAVWSGQVRSYAPSGWTTGHSHWVYSQVKPS